MKMGEAASSCLLRSNSQPLFASCEFKEGDPTRALTTSVSFGRFLTEPLNWERWSSFSHNRTLEDVQKYSRPGVVAEKKAFFEAHYKNFALKKTAKLHEKENQALNYSPQINVITNISPVAISKTDSVADEKRGNEPINRLSEQGIASNVDAHSPSTTSLVFSKGGSVDDIILSTIQVEQDKQPNEDVPSPSTNLVFSQVCDAKENVPSTSQVEQVKVSTGNIDFEDHQSEVKVANRSSLVDKIKKRYIKDKQPNEDIPSPSTNLVFSQVCDAEENVPSTSQVEQVKVSTGNIDFEDHQSEVKVANRSSLVDKIKKRYIKDAASDPNKLSGQIKHAVTSAKSLSRNEPYKKLQSPRKASLTPTVHPKKAAGVVTDKKRSVLQSLHMSMNFPPARNKDVASKTISKLKDRLTQQALTRVSVIGVKENSQVLPRPESKRSKTPIDRSVNGSRTVASKSHSTNHSETSSPCAKKPRSSTVPSSFSFRSDERAAKRKEFFQKLEEKSNTDDTKKIQLQPKLKEKPRSDNKKLRWSTTLDAKPSTRETKAPINSMQKVTPTKPCSPKLGRKPAPRPVEDTQSPHWRSSSKPKNFIEINKKKLSSYMAKKKVCDSTLMSAK